MFAKREIMALQSANQFVEIFNPLLAANEELRPTRVTNEIWLTILINPSYQSFSSTV